MEIKGHFNVEAINMLPTSLKWLDMVIADDQDARDWSETLPKHFPVWNTLVRCFHLSCYCKENVSDKV